MVASNPRVLASLDSVGNLTVRQLCEERVVVAVNGRLPGPTIQAYEGDTLMFTVPAAERVGGRAAYVTQCPIQPGQSYTYKFDVVGQEGTLWWHAHASWLRATVYGALIVLPSPGSQPYPFPQPYAEVPILLDDGQVTGGLPNVSDAFMVNGKPGDRYPCSSQDMYTLTVVPGKAFLLRIINAALNNQLFFKIAGHSLTVVAVDANYVNPYRADVVVIASGQTVDALLVADAAPGSYYMAALPYVSTEGVEFDATIATGVVKYESTLPSLKPVMPALPFFNETATAYRFYSSLTGLRRRGSPAVPLTVDEKMFIAFGLGLIQCPDAAPCNGALGERLAGSMNNISFQLPSEMSLLEASYHGVKGVYTPDFPNRPPREFDYANPDFTYDFGLVQTAWGTRVKRVKYNATVEVVLQKTSLLALQSHPIHLHGFDFFVLAQGFGTYNATAAEKKFNLVNPQVRNTISVPTGGWAVIRFVADNPGIWLMHCHLDIHSSWGMAMAFEVEDGPTPSARLPPHLPTSPAAETTTRPVLTILLFPSVGIRALPIGFVQRDKEIER
ncbi:unnamed protein product [Spirodela intermedia]|uniref:Laccase n=1 Tax=Spirodela intermedia TaxID=51605 RepID=A0A7I8ICL4_SPIIN|nr:unnamed protein product [Spirodela intermedia]CAA6655073.1 unnamed protein product [Spirodela intermedia]